MAKKKKEEIVEPPKEPTALEKELSGFDSVKKAALLMRVLGEQQAAEIIALLNRDEVEKLGTAMVDVGDVTQDAVDGVLDDVIAQLRGQTNLGLGSKDYVEGVLRRALGPDKSASVLSRILPSASSKGLEILAWMTPQNIYELIGDEHPQVIAIILSVLEHDVAAEVLEYVSESKRSEIIKRVASLDSVQPSAMAELEGIMAKQFSNNTTSRASNLGGIETAAKIMNFAKVDVESGVMSGVTKMDKDLASQIQDRMNTFDNMADIDNRSMQTLLRSIENDLLMSALRGADEAIKDKFLSNMSERARDLLLDDMEAKGPIRVSEVEAAQKAIMQIARKLSDDGEIMLAGAGEAFV